jgi:alpha-L-rhamnosidase
MEKLLGDTLIPQILDAGYNFDFIDDRAIESAGVSYPILIVPGAERMPVATLERLQAHKKKGGIVIVTRRLPSLSPGLVNAERDTPRVHQLGGEVFAGNFIKDEKKPGEELATRIKPDFESVPEIGFIHRKLDDGEIYFVANTSNHAVHTRASVRVSGLERSGGIRSPPLPCLL